MSFEHPTYLFLLICIPLLAVVYMRYLRWKKQKMKAIGDPELVQLLISDYSAPRFQWKFVAAVVALALMIVALANPRRVTGSSNVKRNGIDVLVALDVSRSMLAEDIKPSRLERAKQLVSRLIDNMPDNRFGIVVFAGRAYLQMPLTSDLSAAKMYLASANTDVVPTQGTVVNDALKMCFAAFSNKEKKYKSIVLISDGEDHDEAAKQMAQSLAAEGVVVNTVGIGSPDGANIADPVTGELKKDAEGKTVVTRLNEESLKNIASITGGIYAHYSNTDEVAGAIESKLASMEQHGITETSLASYQYFFQWLLGAAFILLMMEMLLSEKKKKTRQQAALATALLLLAPCFSIAQKNIEWVKKGNELYNQQQYSAAADSYKKAAAEKPADATAQYNLGNALYRSNKTEEAIKAYDQAVTFEKNKTDKAQAFYNKGVVLQHQKKLPECIDAYKNALKLNPADEDARLNLQKAIQQQKQQEKQKQEQQKKEEKDKKQNEQQQQRQQPKPQPTKMTKKEAEEKLKALLQQEKNLQDKLRRVDASSPNKPEKDW